MIKDYGYRSPVIEAENYFSGVLPKEIKNPSGDWRKFTPQFEPQFGAGFDTLDCTIFGLENQAQIYIKAVFGIDVNYSERFVSNGMNRDNSVGQDPHLPLEWVRKSGLIKQELLPMVFTLAEYQTPRPLPQNLIDEGKKWEFELKHEYIFANSPNKENRLALLREYLQYSPLGVSVTAWSEQNGLYVDNGLPNGHWCVLVHIDLDGIMYVYDSYDLIVNGISTALIKKLHPDHHIEVAKRIYITRKLDDIKEQLNWVEKLVAKLVLAVQEFLKKKPMEYKPINEVMPPILDPDLQPIIHPIEPKRDLIKEFCLAIQEKEGFWKGSRSERNNNPGNVKWVGQLTAIGKDEQGFAKFQTYKDGFKHLYRVVENTCAGLSEVRGKDYTILEFFAGTLKKDYRDGYAPKRDKNNPLAYANFVANKLKILPTTKMKELLN